MEEGKTRSDINELYSKQASQHGGWVEQYQGMTFLGRQIAYRIHGG